MQSQQPEAEWESDEEEAITVEVDEPFADQVDPENLRDAVQATLDYAGRPEAELAVIITTDQAVQDLNRDYRGVDAPTDVLSFGAQEVEVEVEGFGLALPPELEEVMAAYLGDVVIAHPYAARQAAHYGNSLAAELRLLVVHGTLHLLGYDHDTPAAEAAMWAAQAAVLAAWGDPPLTDRRYDEDHV